MSAKKKVVAKNAASRASRMKIAVENVNVPGYTHRVDAAMYHAMRRALLRVLPAKAPGLTQTEMGAAVLAYLPGDLFPKGAKAGWWSKTVQLDLEAKGLVARHDAKPLRWHKVK
jgi:hypothetical protein